MSARKTMLVLLVSMFFIASCASLPFGATSTPAPTPTPKPISVSDPDFLLGLWRGLYAGNDVAMTFEANGNVTIAAYGNLQAGIYTLDLTTIPYQLNMDIEDVGPIATIIEFVDENTVKIENVYPFDPRPSVFSDFFLLTRSSK